MDKSSSLASELWPYLLPRIERLVSLGVDSGSGGSVVSGAPTPHALSSTHHSGILSDSQGPQFLKIDGTRTLVGSLPVNPGITIDGVDLSAHVADPDAHHARVTVGNTGIALSGQQVSLFLNATGSGLEIVDGLRLATSWAGAGLTLNGSWILDVGQGDGLTVSADAVALTTPGSLSNTSTNAAAGNHTHAVTASADVGTTPAAALLKSTSAGGIVLGTATVKGSVDIVNGGDFTVGNNILFVDNSLESIGINRAPDPQFDLDIAGNLRAVYIVGKHAIQLKNVLLLAHFDGREPYETNFYGEPNGHMGQIGTGNEYAVYRPGLYYKALQVARSTGNYVPNPSFEVNVTDGWTYVQGGTGGSVTRLATDAYVGTACAYLMASSAGYSAIINYSLITIAGAGYVTASYYVYDGGAATNVGLEIYTSGGVLKAFNNVTTAGDADNWQRVTLTWQNDTGAPATIGIAVNNRQNDGTTPILVDAVQFEAQTFASPYFDGSVIVPSSTLSEAWNGTAHNSASTRQNASFGYPAAGNLDVTKGTLMAWVYVTQVTDTKLVFGHGAGADEYVLLQINAATVVGTWGSVVLSGGTVAANTWTHVAMVWGLGSASLYVNGALVDYDTGVGATVLAANLYVGGYGGSQWLDGLIDDLCILDRAIAAGAIRSIYESDAPVFAESSVFHFRATPKGLVWADEEGLWMRDVSGNPVLGAYGGEAATKSWGGLTLGVGDILIGRSPSGYLHWDDSLDTLVVTGQITIQNPEDISYSTISGLPTLGALAAKNSADFAADVSGATKPANNATVGATWGTDLGNIPNTLGALGAAGLYLAASGMGYWNGSAFRTFIKSDGKFFFGGESGATLAWDGTDLYGTNGTTVQWYARASTGKLYAGGGAVVIDAAGVHGYAAGPTLTWEGNTSGQLTAGTGAVILDDDGITIEAATVLSAADKNKLKFKYGSAVIGELYSWYADTINEYRTEYYCGNPDSGQINLNTYSAGVGWKTFTVRGGDASLPGLYLGAGVKAVSSAGLSLQDDGGNVGLTVNDGGTLTLGTIQDAYADTATFNRVPEVALRNTNNTNGNYTAINSFNSAGTVNAGIDFINIDHGYKGAVAITTRVSAGTYARRMIIDENGNAWFQYDVSALTFTDRTKSYEGDALAELAGVRAKNGKIDHATLPAFARSADGEGRDLGAMISMLTVAVQQLAGRLDTLEGKL